MTGDTIARTKKLSFVPIGSQHYLHGYCVI
jgi:hypothetical protein